MNDQLGVRDEIWRGIAWLDENEPGWRDLIAPGDLRMNNGCRCILGQVFSIFSKKAQLNGYSSVVYGPTGKGIDWALQHGFTMNFSLGEMITLDNNTSTVIEAITSKWNRLGEEWLIAIKESS